MARFAALLTYLWVLVRDGIARKPLHPGVETAPFMCEFACFCTEWSGL